VEVALGEAELKRDPRRATRVAGAPVQAIGALQGAHRGFLLAEPPTRHPETLEPGGRRSVVDARLKRLARRLPLAGGQRRAPGFLARAGGLARHGLVEHREQDTPVRSSAGGCGASRREQHHRGKGVPALVMGPWGGRSYWAVHVRFATPWAAAQRGWSL
jgi:hypothetical protein